jgi:nucleoside-diphosphate-sugar epimerase
MENETEMFQTYNVGSNKVYSVLEVLDMMKSIADHKAPIEFISGKPSMIPTRKIDSNKIKEKLGWEATTPITVGLIEAYNWYNKHKDEFNK